MSAQCTAFIIDKPFLSNAVSLFQFLLVTSVEKKRKLCFRILEFTRLRSAGFVVRETYTRFLDRYKMLSTHTWPSWQGAPVEVTIKSLYIMHLVCFYPINVKTAEPIGPNFFCSTSRDPREDLLMLKITKICIGKLLIFLKFMLE